MKIDGLITDKEEIKLINRERGRVLNIQVALLFLFGFSLVGSIYYRMYFLSGMSMIEIANSTLLFIFLLTLTHLSLNSLTNDLIYSKLFSSAVICSAVVTYYITLGIN